MSLPRRPFTMRKGSLGPNVTLSSSRKMARWWSKREASALRVHGGCTDTERTCVACLRVVQSESKVNERQRKGSAPLSLVPGASRGAGRPVATVPGNRWLARSPRKEHAWTRVRAKGDIARSVDNFIAEQPRLGEPGDRPSYRHFRFHFGFLPRCGSNSF